MIVFDSIDELVRQRKTTLKQTQNLVKRTEIMNRIISQGEKQCPDCICEDIEELKRLENASN